MGFLNSNKERFELDADTRAVAILEEIKNVLHDDSLTDFDVIESIVTIFEDNNIYCGGCHDFG